MCIVPVQIHSNPNTLNKNPIQEDKKKKSQRLSDGEEDERRWQDRRRGKENEQIIDQPQHRQRQEHSWCVTPVVVGPL